MVRKRPKSVRAVRASQKDEGEDLKKAPHSFVIHQGKVGKYVRQLIRDVRRVMEPYTASRVKVKKWNKLKDFTAIAGLLNVTQTLCFSKTENSVNLRIIRQPRGPTLHFKVRDYTLVRDVISSASIVNQNPKQYEHHPLLVMKNLGGKSMNLKLIATMFQNLFPTINVNQVKLKKVKRCLLLNYDPETKLLQIRHYNISVVPVGLGRAIRKVIKGKKIPNLANYTDISDYVEKDGNLSESEAEFDGLQNEVILPQKMSGPGNTMSQKSAIRLIELGPRLTLELEKIEEGVCSGDVLYHSFKTKSAQDLKVAQNRREAKRKLKEKRKKEQRENVLKKARLKAHHKEKSLEGIKKATELREKADSKDKGQEEAHPVAASTQEDMDDLEDDIEYYRQEVQAEPEPELFTKKRKANTSPNVKAKKAKTDSSVQQKKRKFDQKSTKQNRQDTKSPKYSKKIGSKSVSHKKTSMSNKSGKNTNRFSKRTSKKSSFSTKKERRQSLDKKKSKFKSAKKGKRH